MNMQSSNKVSSAELLYMFGVEWWDNLCEARTAFFNDFALTEKRNDWLQSKRLKQFGILIGQESPADIETQKNVRRLCSFYDRMGYYAMINLISPKDIILPIWHSMIKTWETIKPFVDKEREPNDIYYDPIFMIGFEFLYDCATNFFNPIEILPSAFTLSIKDTDRSPETYKKQIEDTVNKYKAILEAKDKELEKFRENINR